MMGTQTVETQLFYEFDLDAHVPPRHILREIDRFLDMAAMREQLRPFYKPDGGARKISRKQNLYLDEGTDGPVGHGNATRLAREP